MSRRQRVRATPGSPPGARVVIGIQLARVGEAATGSGTVSTEERGGTVQGPFSDRSEHTTDAGTITDVFTVFMWAPEQGETDTFVWIAPTDFDGALSEDPDATISFAGDGSSTQMTVEYSDALSSSVARFACLVNGVPYVGSVNIGSTFGA